MLNRSLIIFRNVSKFKNNYNLSSKWFDNSNRQIAPIYRFFSTEITSYNSNIDQNLELNKPKDIELDSYHAQEPVKLTNTTENKIHECVSDLITFHKSFKNNEFQLEDKKEEFEQLLDKVYKNIRKLSIKEIGNVYHILSYFNVKNNTMIMQAVLQMIRMNINDLPISSIIHFHMLLSKQEKTLLGEAIKYALPIAFEQARRHQLYGESIEVLASAFWYATKYSSHGTIMYIKNMIEQDIEKLNEKASIYIIRGMQNKSYTLDECRTITFKALDCLGKSRKIPYKAVQEQYHQIFERRKNHLASVKPNQSPVIRQIKKNAYK